MAYRIVKTDGTLLTTILDGTLNTTATSLVLPGPNYVGYGEFLDENLVHILENFASNTAPSGTSLVGQLWYNTNTKSLNVYSDQGGGGYVPVTGITVAGLQPTIANSGNMWYNSTTNQLYFYDGTSWNLVGPLYTKAQGISGAVPADINDGNVSGVIHNVIQLQYGSFVYAILSSDSEFTPATPIPGFSVIKPGININSTITNPTINSNIAGVLNGTVYGDVYGNVVGTTLTGTLRGPVFGDVTGNVSATTIVADTTFSKLVSTQASVTNFSSGNANITGGSIQDLSFVGASIGRIGNLTVGTFSASSIANIAALSISSENSLAINFSTGNAVITGGYINNLANISADTGTFTSASATTVNSTNLRASNVVITGGYINNLANISATTGTLDSLVVDSVTALGGNISGLTSMGATTASVINFSSSNATITGGNVLNVSGANVMLSNSVLNNSTATTKTTADKSTAIATTEFVHGVLPYGAIIMWYGTTSNVPSGWHICDGSNGTPDLRNRFIIGAGAGYNPAVTGGSTSVNINIAVPNLPPHSHTFNANGSVTGTTSSSQANLSDPGHVHTYTSPTTASGPAGTTVSINTATTTASTSRTTTGVTDSGHVHTFTGTASIAGTSGTTGTGSPIPVTTMPPFYALCFIMKVI